jgi:hypothetical protein
MEMGPMRSAPRHRVLAAASLVAVTTQFGWWPRCLSAEPQAKTESFDRDPQWIGVNNRSAQLQEPRTVRQDFGYSSQSQHAGGAGAGEIGGFISPDGHAAYYAKPIRKGSFDEPLTASGTLLMGEGPTHLLLGFFNSNTVNEWRTPNSMAIRLNGRGDKFFAYVEYCTSKWRAGGDTTPFPSMVDPETGRLNLIGFPSNRSLKWKLAYDPEANDGKGQITATIGEATAVCTLEATHRSDGAEFNRFGIINVIKSVDTGSDAWFDDVAINGQGVESFDHDPQWEGRDNRQTVASRIVRPWFDFGYSPTHFAAGKASGELGGQIFRGDCREKPRLACYGDRIGPLSLDKPLKASGRVVLKRGVSDSTALFGFYNSRDSMRQNESQSDGIPESVLGIHIEGPSRDGFRFYPVLRAKGGNGRTPRVDDFPIILPDGKSHQWSLVYLPGAEGAKARITVTFDGKTGDWTLSGDDLSKATRFDRFGIVTSWIDGNSQDVYWDDLTYTVSQR